MYKVSWKRIDWTTRCMIAQLKPVFVNIRIITFDSNSKLVWIIEVSLLYLKQEAPSSLYHAHAYMWAPVPQGSLWFFCVLYTPDINISYVMGVVAECVVMHQSRCVEPGVKVAGSLVTRNGFPPSWKAKICLHKFPCTNVTRKRKTNGKPWFMPLRTWVMRSSSWSSHAIKTTFGCFICLCFVEGLAKMSLVMPMQISLLWRMMMI